MGSELICLAALVPHTLGLLAVARSGGPILRRGAQAALLLGMAVTTFEVVAALGGAQASPGGASFNNIVLEIASGRLGWTIALLPILLVLSPIWLLNRVNSA